MSLTDGVRCLASLSALTRLELNTTLGWWVMLLATTRLAHLSIEGAR
jgi:hypothetical protein